MQLQNVMRSVFTVISQIGSHPDDSATLRLQKTMLLTIALMITVFAFIWAAIYFAYREPLAASIPFSYSIFSLISIGIFQRNRAYNWLRTSQLFLILMLPFVLMFVLGGFINSSAVILWSFLCPLGALVFDKRQRAMRWFLAFLALVVISGVLAPVTQAPNNLPPTLVLIFFVLNISAVSTTVFFTLHYFVGQKDEAFSLLSVQQEKAEHLLLNILPPEIVEALQEQGGTIADHFDEVSILFADIVDFTPMSAEMEPKVMVDLLNEVFSYFDSLVEQYGLEKIKTIGDAYMVAAGVPRPRADHAHVIAAMALDMQNFMTTHAPGATNGKRVRFRIGINSGPVVAGVIGHKKFQYDMWSDAVNTASRMESHGKADMIQITEETYRYLKDDFICEPRGEIMVKGKGPMETWILKSAKP